jgi:hypothetical protein
MHAYLTYPEFASVSWRRRVSGHWELTVWRLVITSEPRR